MPHLDCSQTIRGRGKQHIWRAHWRYWPFAGHASSWLEPSICCATFWHKNIYWYVFCKAGWWNTASGNTMYENRYRGTENSPCSLFSTFWEVWSRRASELEMCAPKLESCPEKYHGTKKRLQNSHRIRSTMFPNRAQFTNVSGAGWLGEPAHKLLPNNI